MFHKDICFNLKIYFTKKHVFTIKHDFTPRGPLVYPALFCYQIMNLIDKIVHYYFYFRSDLFLNWCILALKLKKNK